MIVIDQNNNGAFVIALRDKVQNYIDDNYTFKFVNELTREEISLSYLDISPYKYRYSEFNYTSSTFINATAGFWKYEVIYHTGIIANGKMLLQNTHVLPVQYDGYDTTAIVYQK